MSQPPYPYGNPHDPASQPPSDPYQQTGYSPFPDPEYSDPGYQQATYQAPSQYPPTQPYVPTQPYPAAQPYGQDQPVPGYPTYQQPRRGPTVLIVTVVALLLVLVVGGGIAAAYLLPKDNQPTAQGSHTPAPSDSAAPSASASAAPSSSLTPGGGQTHSGDLRTFLLPLPAGLKKCQDEEGTNNALTLDQAADLSSDPTKRRGQLQDDNFTAGAARCWIASDNKTIVDVRLYQFDTTADANDFYDADVNGTAPGYDADDITPVSGVPDGTSFANPVKDDNGYVQVISIALRGDVVLVVAVEQPPPVKVSTAETVLVQQYQKL